MPPVKKISIYKNTYTYLYLYTQLSHDQNPARTWCTILQRVQFPTPMLWISEHLQHRKRSSLCSCTNEASDFYSVYVAYMLLSARV